MKTIYDIPLRTIDGQATDLKPYQGQCMLIVNVASRCGFTKQYQELETFYREYRSKGCVVLGFPCNQFFKQEPEGEKVIKTLATECFNVTFPLFEKCKVKGKNQAPLYQYLQRHMKKKSLIFIPWNFSKVLVDQKGQVIQRFSPLNSMNKIRQVVDTLLDT